MTSVGRNASGRGTGRVRAFWVMLPLFAGLAGCSGEPPKLPPPPRDESPTTEAAPPSGGAAPDDVARPGSPAPDMPDESKTESAGVPQPPPPARAPPPAAGDPQDQPGAGRKYSRKPEPSQPSTEQSAPPSGQGAPAPSASPAPVGSARPRIGAARSLTAPVTVDAPAYDVVPVFFGTDRSVEPNDKRLEYGSGRGRKLQLGRALITVPTIHKVPNIERPWVVEIPYFKVKIYAETESPDKHFTVQDIGSLTREQMLSAVRERLAGSKNFKDHAIVFVHGFNTSFDYALYRTAQIAYDLKFDGAPFLYTWPSGGKVASYTYDRGSAEQAEPFLIDFLNFVIKESGAKSISLIAHSMGNELLLRVLEQMRPSPPAGVEISQVILAAPDVDRDKFDNVARQITGFARGVTLYAASNDHALSYSGRFWGGVPRAGDVPSIGPLIVPGVDTIDVTSVSTDSLGLNHSGYAENNALLNDIKLLIQTGERPPDKRIPILQKMHTVSGGEYWRYPPLR